ncbi:hypothetical protein [Mycolicibacterium llatzerense]|uniref:hypothetical protein n=1 Tax=Mycolicibacterium llatzerense TaxID=280871 RepID=UPI0021B58F20|nr:hypothetical protein [Mycolicibacterium llatzerense]MCT7372119.1 hypothetical protein [Mycolicibacterium llatzerense]
MQEYLVVTPKGTYRVPLDSDEAGTLIDLLDYYVSKDVASGPDRLRAMTRQQVLAQLGRSTLPESKDNPFPESAIVVGEENGGGSFTRGWLPWQISTWQDDEMQARITANAAELGDASDAHVAEPEPETQAPEADGDGQRPEAQRAPWTYGTRVWEIPGAAVADTRVVIITSRGIVTPSGYVLSRKPLPTPADLQRFILFHWKKKPAELPQLWFTAEAMDSLGIDVEDADPNAVDAIVASTFDCKVSWSQSGFFTCRWGAAATAEGADADAASARSATLVFMPWMPLNPSDARPGDLGVAGIEGTSTELPEDEDQAAPILAERIAWLMSLGDGVAPSSRWSTVGAAYADVKRATSSVRRLPPGPVPAEVAASQSDLDPDMHEGKRPHKAKSDHIIVETDQRSAYLASAGQLQLGYGEPTRVTDPESEVLNTQKPPFGLWRVTTPAGKKIDGLDMRLPLPNGYMSRDEPSTFWTTTRGAQHLIASVDVGGAGLSPAELQIDAAWLWPQQTQLLRQWTAGLRDRLNEAIAEGREDRVDMLKAMYKAYLGRTRSDKWGPRQKHHHQPVHYASIQADVRWRALKFAVGIKERYGWYPVAADVDAWIYWLPADADPSVLEEDAKFNGKYRIKAIQRPGQMPEGAA